MQQKQNKAPQSRAGRRARLRRLCAEFEAWAAARRLELLNESTALQLGDRK